MRLLAALLVLGTSFISARSTAQVYLHPAPVQDHVPVPTLTPAQAKAVISHHIGETLEDLEEIPQNEELWSHLIGVWADKRPHGRVVIIEGVSPQGGRSHPLCR